MSLSFWLTNILKELCLATGIELCGKTAPSAKSNVGKIADAGCKTARATMDSITCSVQRKLSGIGQYACANGDGPEE